eukprot:gene3313-4103_t
MKEELREILHNYRFSPAEIMLILMKRMTVEEYRQLKLWLGVTDDDMSQFVFILTAKASKIIDTPPSATDDAWTPPSIRQLERSDVTVFMAAKSIGSLSASSPPADASATSRSTARGGDGGPLSRERDEGRWDEPPQEISDGRSRGESLPRLAPSKASHPLHPAPSALPSPTLLSAVPLSSGTGTRGARSRRRGRDRTARGRDPSPALHGLLAYSSAPQLLPLLSAGPGASTSTRTVSSALESNRLRPMELQRELLTSMTMMQRHTEQVKDDILKTRELLRLHDHPSKARGTVLRIAAERMQAALYLAVGSDCRRGLCAWRMAISQERRLRTYLALIQFVQLRVVAVFTVDGFRRMLKRRLLLWRSTAREAKRRSEAHQRHRSVVMIQKVARGVAARQRVAEIIERRKYQRLYEATITLQSFFRGRLERLRFLRRHQLKKEAAARAILQRVERGRRGRRRATLERRRKDRYAAATKIQTLYRCQKAFGTVQVMRQQRRENTATTFIQALVRGFLTRRRKQRLARMKLEKLSATKIQALIRG